ncbi:glycosyltransferase [Pseudomonas sp. X10]
MNIVNVMWAGGAAYWSVHKVHQQILSQAGENISVTNWLLQGQNVCCALGNTREWHLSQRLLKGRHLWRLLRPWLRARLCAALQQANAHTLLLDGLGVARLMLPVLRTMPELRATILFHGSTRLHATDLDLLRSIPAQRLTIAAVSSTLAHALEQDIGRPVQALRIALDPYAFQQKLKPASEARQALGLSDDIGRVMGAVGRLVESKGFDLLLDAFARAAARQPDLSLVILGEGELRQHLQARIESLGLAERVFLLGHREDLAQLYRAFDCLLVPSRSEGLGLVVQEAVLADVPVLCSDLPVFHEQLGDVPCYLPIDDVEAWASAIEQCQALPAAELAAAQRRSLAPERGWEAFCQRSASLLGR